LRRCFKPKCWKFKRFYLFAVYKKNNFSAVNRIAGEAAAFWKEEKRKMRLPQPSRARATG